MHFQLRRYFTLISLTFCLITGGTQASFYRGFTVGNMLRLQESGNVNRMRGTSYLNPLPDETASLEASELGNNSRIQEIHKTTLELLRGCSTCSLTTIPKSIATGLGRSIAGQIVRRHGGKIAFQTKAAVGSTFAVTLSLNPLSWPSA